MTLTDDGGGVLPMNLLSPFPSHQIFTSTREPSLGFIFSPYLQQLLATVQGGSKILNSVDVQIIHIQCTIHLCRIEIGKCFLSSQVNGYSNKHFSAYWRVSLTNDWLVYSLPPTMHLIMQYLLAFIMTMMMISSLRSASSGADGNLISKFAV